MIPRGIRNKNPGNLDYHAAAFERDPWVGEIGLETHPSPRFTTFEASVFGIRALAKTLVTYSRHRKAADGSPIDTVQEIIDRWAPASENDTDSYAEIVRRAIGVEVDERIDIENEETLSTLVMSIIRHENAGQPYGRATIALGVQLALA